LSTALLAWTLIGMVAGRDLVRQAAFAPDYNVSKLPHATQLQPMFMFFLLFARFFYLQVIQHEYYDTLAEANRISIVPIVPNRGIIVDRNGVVLAHNYSAYTLEITPSKVDDVEGLIDELATVIEITPVASAGSVTSRLTVAGLPESAWTASMVKPPPVSRADPPCGIPSTLSATVRRASVVTVIGKETPAPGCTATLGYGVVRLSGFAAAAVGTSAATDRMQASPSESSVAIGPACGRRGVGRFMDPPCGRSGHQGLGARFRGLPRE
jgi:hypothetical protein